jgi:1-acyl-sn-glycerol-3-phosphate acyltransferase
MQHLRGLLTVLLLLVNLCVWGTAVLLVALLKLITRGETRRWIILRAARLGERWAGGNDRIFDSLLPTRWDIRGLERIDHDGHFLIISNHISWVDIFALFRAFNRRAPLLRFFLKQVLIWFPIAGQACWALEFPFMKRYSPQYLERHPEKRGTDLATTRKACERYRRIPVSIVNFVEGTRFTADKHAAQEAPYLHLLRPRIGGVGFVLAALGDQLEAMFDVTLAYPDHDTSFWHFVCGRLPRIIVHVRRIDIPTQFFSDAITEPGPLRDQFALWIEELWRQKDELLATLI